MKLLKIIVNKFLKFRVIVLLIFYSILITQFFINYIIEIYSKKTITNHIIKLLKLKITEKNRKKITKIYNKYYEFE
jgi:hypothetical protein